jgi:hypothetical protein
VGAGLNYPLPPTKFLLQANLRTMFGTDPTEHGNRAPTRLQIDAHPLTPFHLVLLYIQQHFPSFRFLVYIVLFVNHMLRTAFSFYLLCIYYIFFKQFLFFQKKIYMYIQYINCSLNLRQTTFVFFFRLGFQNSYIEPIVFHVLPYLQDRRLISNTNFLMIQISFC